MGSSSGLKNSLRNLKNLSWLNASQMGKLTKAMSASLVAKRGIIFDERSSPDTAYILLSGAARITCQNRKGRRGMLIMLAPGMIPSFPLPVVGIKYNFRCEAVTDCQIGTVDLEKLLEISLGQIASTHFKRMAANYIGQWDWVLVRCSNFMSCTVAERLALALLELGQGFGVDYLQGLRLTVSTRHQDLAELVGATRPRVTESLNHFERSDMIARENRYLILKRERLEGFLQ